MSAHIIPQSSQIAKHLTPVQREVWQKLMTAPPEALNADGRIRADYIATAWPGGTDALGWANLVRVTIHSLNKRLARRRIPVRIVGQKGQRGYRIVAVESERAA